MDFEAKIEPMPFRRALVVRTACKTLQMPKVIGPAFGRVLEYLKAKGVEPKHPPFVRYYGFTFDEMNSQGFLKMMVGMFTRVWQVEIGFPVEMPIDGTAELNFVEYPYQQAATCIHRGPYQKMGNSYKKLSQWVKLNGRAPEDTSFEVYLNDPHNTAAKNLETVILMPLKK